MKKGIDVLTLGDLCVDLILADNDIIPEFGQKEKIFSDYSIEMGGSCSIFACQTAKLGLNTTLIGSVGADIFGELICSTLKDSGVSIERIKTDQNIRTGMSVVLNRYNDRAILTYKGSIDAVDVNDISDKILQSVRHFHVGSYFLMKKIQPYYVEILKKLKVNGATVSLDTNWDPEGKWNDGLWEIMPYIDVFFPNENEAIAITGEKDIYQAVKRLTKEVPLLVVKRGKDGAAAYTDKTSFTAKALPVETVIDTVGAGDSFDGGFIYGFLSGRTIKESLDIGCICGSLNTRKAGGVKGQPAVDELVRNKQTTNS
jgi:sugar/nucleoside kinase (ribokinase family)